MIDTKLTREQQLALITSIRRLISNIREPPVKEILQTNILSIIEQIFRFGDTISEEIRAMKLESLWILTNLAYGEVSDT
jgi:hypothetical protein